MSHLSSPRNSCYLNETSYIWSHLLSCSVKFNNKDNLFGYEIFAITGIKQYCSFNDWLVSFGPITPSWSLRTGFLHLKDRITILYLPLWFIPLLTDIWVHFHFLSHVSGAVVGVGMQTFFFNTLLSISEMRWIDHMVARA